MMSLINLFTKKPKKVVIINTYNNVAPKLTNVEFDIDLYKEDYKIILKKILPEYIIDFQVIDDKNSVLYPKIKGNITELEKSMILKTLETSQLRSLNLNEKYYILKIKVTSFINNNNLQRNHKDDSKCIKDGSFDLSNFEKRELTAFELFFLKYISRPNYFKGVSGDWTYDYHLNYQDVLNQFVGQGLVIIEDLCLDKKMNLEYKVDDLKQILRKKYLPLDGNKASLIERVINNSNDNELQEIINKRYIKYSLTEKGKTLTTHLNPSITRDMELEDKYYDLVMNNSIDKAYRLIEDFKAQKDFSGLGFGISVGDSKNSNIGLNDKQLFKYRRLTNTNFDLPDELMDKKQSIIACIIVGHMFGCKSYLIANLIQRLIKTGLENEEVDKYVTYGLSCIREFQ